ncbi:unnamed protein product [Paramecium pentaurelia]|uniref:Uncharacterized protein n=1 Tax=Paramecium pentaurelia TaxID=43138 RepID=A0A8S1TRB4_9CILI|nr:unnamed protein product [Paramecium pentaurelia]
MDQNLDQQDIDRTDQRGNLQHDINDKCKEIEPKVYSHQYEFIQYWMLINNSLLLHYTENSKTLNF